MAVIAVVVFENGFSWEVVFLKGEQDLCIFSTALWYFCVYFGIMAVNKSMCCSLEEMGGEWKGNFLILIFLEDPVHAVIFFLCKHHNKIISKYDYDWYQEITARV